MESAIAGGGGGADVLPDWTLLPEDFLVTVMGELDIIDLIRTGAVCARWYSAYMVIRRLRLPSLRQPPCLLYSVDAPGSDAAALYCPSTGANFEIPFPQLRGLSPIGSAHGWLVVADEVSNLHLMNPLTGGRVALPPITTLRGVEDGTTFDEDGNLVYNFHEDPEDAGSRLAPIPVVEAADCTYERAVLSCAPSSVSGCVVLLLHWPYSELSYARPGDERWTWISGLPQRNCYWNASYNDKDGLFYVVHFDGFICSLDLNGSSPVVRMIIPELRLGGQPYRYLVHTPWGELLQVLRFRKEHELSTLPAIARDVDDYDELSVELRTTVLQLYKVDSRGQQLVKLEGLRDHALFLGYNESLCLRVTEFPGLKPNCVYIMDDSPEFMNYGKRNKREIGVWDIERQRLQSFDESSDLKLPWLSWPPPIWITPSLF